MARQCEHVAEPVVHYICGDLVEEVLRDSLGSDGQGALGKLEGDPAAFVELEKGRVNPTQQVDAVDRLGVGPRVARLASVGLETDGVGGQLGVAVQRVDAEVVAHGVA